MNYRQLLAEAMANDPLSIPLRCRIGALLGQQQTGSATIGKQPKTSDHPRTLRCVQMIEDGLHSLPLHGYASLESIIRVFSQHAIDISDRWYRSCVDTVMELSSQSAQFYHGIGIPGRVLDEHRCGGSRMIRAAALARTGLDDENIIEEEIAESTDVFRMASLAEHPLDLVEPHKGAYVVRAGVALPSYYHLLVLAYTKSWRSPRMVQMLQGAVERLSLVPPAHMRAGSHLVAIALLRGQQWFKPHELTNDIDRALWMDQMVHMLKAGLVPNGRRQKLASGLRELSTRWTESIHDSSPFLKWGAYTGVGLEPDWKSARRKRADLLFRFAEIDQLLDVPAKDNLADRWS